MIEQAVQLRTVPSAAGGFLLEEPAASCGAQGGTLLCQVLALVGAAAVAEQGTHDRLVEGFCKVRSLGNHDAASRWRSSLPISAISSFPRSNAPAIQKKPWIMSS